MRRNQSWFGAAVGPQPSSAVMASLAGHWGTPGNNGPSPAGRGGPGRSRQVTAKGISYMIATLVGLVRVSS
jgi:hypothetical protein